MRMSESSNNSNLNMLDQSNNVTAADVVQTAGIRTPQDDLVIDNNLFYGNDTPDGDQEKNQGNQDSSRPLVPEHKRVDTRISNLDNTHGIEHESFADYEESEHRTGKISTKYK